jgi:SAM-dependent methyltransferase
MSVDRDWERWGRQSPYFGVLSDERFRGGTLDADARREFFASGESHVDAVLALVASAGAGMPPLRRTLDFGCGVGRLLIPLARRSDEAVGVDVSPSMLEEAGRNCVVEGVANVRLLPSSDDLAAVDGEFDLVHSFIVLQHIPPSRGLGMVYALASRVARGGWLVLQFPHHGRGPWLPRLLARVRYRLPWLTRLRNLMTGRPAGDPPMQLHAYPLGEVLPRLRAAGFARWTLHADDSAGPAFDSVLLIARREDVA